MPLRIGINLGFVTNSSSVIHHFPVQLLQHPDVKAFIEAFEISKGFVGSDLWHRGMCATFAVTKEQKEAVRQQLTESEYGRNVEVSIDDDSVVLIYGDEYRSIASSLVHLMGATAQKMNIQCGPSQEYN